MGRSYWFECSKCGYRAQVAGRADSGQQFAVQTVHCHDCRALYDAVTRLRVPDELRLNAWRNFGRTLLPKWPSGHKAGPPPTFQQALNRLPVKGVRRYRWLQFKPACPISPAHRVEFWNSPNKCPRCGLMLEKNALPYRIWD